MRARARHRLRLLAPNSLVAAAWTMIALRRARRALRSKGFAARVSPPPPLPWRASRGVGLVLRRMDRTCLERAVVEQAWLVAHGRPADVVIGVAADGGDLKAHAWVDGRAGRVAADYDEIHRIAPALRPPR